VNAALGVEGMERFRNSDGMIDREMCDASKGEEDK